MLQSRSLLHTKIRQARREVAKRIERELSKLLLDSGRGYDEMRVRHPDFLVFLIAQKHDQDRVPLGDLNESEIILKDALKELPAHSQHLRALARAFVAAQFHVSPGAVAKDLSVRKPRKTGC